ncbi:MAG: hypothetical protein GEV10_01245 [Streptosporangiales bacterium]|nr:hypothetical protein [Streptosporangiales bacterium]
MRASEAKMADGERNRGRAVSWIAVVIILAGFTLGGVALILGNWLLFWISVGVVVVGGIFAVAVDIFADVELDPLHEADAEDHVSPIHGTVTERSRDRLEPAVPGDAPDVSGEPVDAAAETSARRDSTAASN